MIFALLACTTVTGTADDVCASEFLMGAADPDGRSIGVSLADADGAYTIHGELHWPNHAPEAGERWPVAVVLHGGWDQQGTPITPDNAHPDVGRGIVALHLDFPGNGLSGGENDRRGAETRAAVAAALRYAVGETTDLGGCTSVARAGSATAPDRLYMLGVSNGGNLAVAVLADDTLDVPAVSGLVTWETPVGPVFANVELGKDPTVYRPGTCIVDRTTGITCPFPEESLAAGTEDLCFDQDDNDRCTTADIIVQGTSDPPTGLRMVSPALRSAADAQGLSLPAYADAETADAWWAERDAVRLVDRLVDRHPELPVLLIGSEEDHVLPWTDHPHVYGWGQALQEAGAFWTRLNPGSEWLDTIDQPNDPNQPILLGGADLHLLTEQEEDPLEGALAAAILELDQRTKESDW